MIAYHEDGSVTVASEPDQAVSDDIPAGLTEKERDQRINAFFAANPEPVPDPQAARDEILGRVAMAAGVSVDELKAALA